MRPAKGSASVLKTKMEHGSLDGDFAIDGVAFVIGLLVAGENFAGRGRGENIGDEIQNGVAADIVERGAEHHRQDALGDYGFAQAFFQVRDRQRAFVEKFLHQRVVAFGDQFDQRLVRGFRFFGHLGGNFADLRFAVAIGLVG